MDEKPLNQPEPVGSEEHMTPSRSSAWPWAAVFVLGCAVVVTLVFFFREQDSRRQLASANGQMSADLNQTRDEVQALNAKVTALMATPPQQPVVSNSPLATEGSASTSKTPARHSAAKRAAKKDDPRWKQMQSELDENKQQIEAARDDVASTRSELQGSLSATKDELGGSIAKTHDELVELEKRGERSYFEFNLTKSKGFERVGPLNLSLRKTNTKNGNYDMAVLVEDSKLNKKHVGLYEPVLFYPSESHQALELVVNRIEKDKVRGYVSAPKYNATSTAANASTSELSKTPLDKDVSLTHRVDDQQ